MKNDDLTVKKTSNSLNPFEWKSFVSEKRDYNLYRTYLGSKIVILNHTTTAFLKNPDRDYISILNSDKIQKIDSLTIFFNQLVNNSWDGTDRIRDLVTAAKLAGDYNQNFELIKKWLCTTYAFALRG
tara:strand:- start:113 stop:493 length:381 start_codon:yes stop_codon:yes gene_type:complete